MLYYDFLVTMHLLFLVFVIGSPLFVRGYSYDKVTGIVKCPDESFNSEFNVTDLNNTTFTKVDRTMLLSYRTTSDDYHRFTTSCTTNVTDMSNMFNGKEDFNHDISTWDTSSVVDMSYMFYNAKSFNSDISNWTTSSVTNMQLLFAHAEEFNLSISTWDTSSVTNMYGTFSGARSFNRDISNWNTSKVDDMSYMFQYAEKFNSNISNWNTSSVMSMNRMFYQAFQFNSDISDWDTSSVTTMFGLFWGASNFNQSITNWCVNISEPTDFSTWSPIKDYPAFLPLWNGTGCTYKCYNNGVRAIPYLENYTCICDQDHMGPYCEEAITTTLTSTLTSTSSSTLTSTSSSTLTTTYTSIEEDRSANSINVNVIIGLVSGGVVLVGFVFFVFCLF